MINKIFKIYINFGSLKGILYENVIKIRIKKIKKVFIYKCLLPHTMKVHSASSKFGLFPIPPPSV